MTLELRDTCTFWGRGVRREKKNSYSSPEHCDCDRCHDAVR